MFFSCLRASGGHNDNPSALQVKYALRKLLFRNSVTLTVNANCFDAHFETLSILEFRSPKSFIDNPDTIAELQLCSVEGYVWSYEIYNVQSKKIEGLDLSGSIVVRLAEELLDESRLVVTDN